MCRQIYMHGYWNNNPDHADKQTVIQVNRQADKQTNRQTDKQTERQAIHVI